MRTSPIYLSILVAVACSQDTGISGKLESGPQAQVQAPSDGDTLGADEALELLGVVSDGNGLDDIVTLEWASDVDGLLADLAAAPLDQDGATRYATTLSVGTHALSLSVTDVDGLSAQDSVSVTVTEVDTSPIAEITVPAAFDRFDFGSPISLVGGVSDPNQAPDTLTAIWGWSSPGGGLNEIEVVVPSATGTVTSEWADAPIGEYNLHLVVFDDDGLQSEAVILVEVLDPNEGDADADGWSLSAGDCDDTDPDVNPGADEACNNVDDDCNDVVDDKDLDGDNHIDEDCGAYPGPKQVDDCDDDDAATFLGASEQLDGVDNDCNGIIDDGLSTFDEDGDCYCSASYCTGSSNLACTTVEPGDCDDFDPDQNLDDVDGDGFSTCDDDCDDNDPSLDPEDADGDGFSTCDNDCDDTAPLLNPIDTDNDGYSTCDGDCADGDPTMTPADLDGDGLSGCDGDCDDTSALLNVDDVDGDGFSTCDGDCDDDDPVATPEDGDGDGLSACDGDCDDNDPLLNQLDGDADGATSCDGDCNDASALLNLQDADGDGNTTCAGDCDDNNAVLNDLDADFDGYSTCDLDCDDNNGFLSPADVDGDGSSTCDGDCNDNDPTADGLDADNDGVTTCDGDCDDNQALAFPGNTEVPYNGIDDDCLFGDEVDVDNDGWTATEAGGTDCDDDDPNVNPSETELCNGKDDDCNEGIDEDNTVDCDDYYFDGDGDGHGTFLSQCSCAPSGSYTADLPDDCYDNNPDANPDQTSFFFDDRGDGSWDYNCDNIEAKIDNRTATYDCNLCGFLNTDCCYSSGWVGGAPDCGEAADYGTGCFWIPTIGPCDPNSETSVTQTCR